MPPDEFWRRLLAPGAPFPHTAAPSVGQFKQAFETALDEGHEGVVCVCLSEELSATVKHAAMAREMIPGKRIQIVDSRSACSGIGALALLGARLAAAGKNAKEIADEMRRMQKSVDLYVALETLEFLRKGGRIGSARAAVGGLLSIKPIITVKDGAVVVVDQPRTRGKATERVIELLTPRPVKELYVLASPPVDVEEWKEMLLDRMPDPKPALVTTQVIGPIIGAHVGPGCYGAVMVHES
jgi:DegV family protein with EDD domain